MKNSFFTNCKSGIFATLTTFALLFSITAVSQTRPELGEAERFDILSGSIIVTNDSTAVRRDVGSEDTLCTKIITEGTRFDDQKCIVYTAEQDLQTAKQDAWSQQGDTLTSTVGDTLLSEGVYTIASVASLEDTIRLSGDSTSIFIFNIAGDLTAESNLRLILEGGVKPENVFFNVDGKATLRQASEISGVMMCDGSITCESNVKGTLRMLSSDSVSLGQQTDTIGTVREPISPQISLGRASTFALLSWGNITCPDPITANGNVGAVEGGVTNNITSTDTLFPSNSCEVQEAMSDLNNAYRTLVNLTGTSLPNNLGGQVLSAGVYEVSGNAILNSTITLTGDSTSVYVFKISGSLTVDAGAIVDLGDVLPQNVYWGVLDNQAFIGQDVDFSGILISGFNITGENKNTGTAAYLSVRGGIDLFNNNPANPVYLLSRMRMEMIVPSLIVANAGPDITISSAQSTQIGSAPVNGLTYKWSPSIGLSDPTIANPMIAVANRDAQPVTLTYKVLVNDGINTATDEVDITILSAPTPPGLGVNLNINDTIPMIVTDRFGDTLLLEDIQRTPGTLICGYFRLTYEDEQNSTGVGFDNSDPGTFLPTKGEEWRECACQVYRDLSELIEPADDPYLNVPTTPLVEIWIKSWDPNSSPNVLGFASPYHLIPPLSFNGIIDGEIWKTINGGFDSYFNLGNVGFPPTQFYHGYAAMNPSYTWHTNWETNNTNSNAYDFYSVFLHEATHSLGFYSLIDASGISKLGGDRYSRFDTYHESSGIPLIVNTDGCYSTLFNSAGGLSASTLVTQCGITFQGASPQPVFSPSGFDPGSSLSHFDPTCPSGLNYVMSPAAGQGSANVKRRSLMEEVSALCDIDFQLREDIPGQATFGDDPLNTFIYKDDYTLCGQRIAGVNDFFIFNTATPYEVQSGDQITISDILDNDENADAFECLELVNQTGSILSSTATSFTYQADNFYTGLVVLRYIPLNTATQQKGNITYVFISVVPPPGTIPPCQQASCGPNLVVNGDFEAGNTGFTSGHNFVVPPTVLAPMEYTIHDDANDINGAWSGVDNTTGAGLFLICDGASAGNVNIWQQTVTVTPNTDYLFSLFLDNLIDVNAWFNSEVPVINVVINGVTVIGNTFITLQPDQWIQLCSNWNSGTANSANIQIGIQGVSGSGNDIGIDDISLRLLGNAPVAAITSKTDESCAGNADGEATVTVTGGTAPFTYLWDDPNSQTMPTAVGLAAGTYNVVVTGANGCTATATVTINAFSGPAVSASISSFIDETCPGTADAEATVSVSGGTAPFTYLWDDFNSQTTPTAVGLTAGTYTVIVTDANGCTATANVTVGANLISATIGTTVDESCAGAADGEATVNVTGGTAPFTYQWDDPNVQTTPTAVGLTAGTYNVVITDDNGCTTTATATVGNTVPPVTTASFTWGTYPLDICMNNPVQFTNTSVPSGISWNWQFGDGNTSSLENPAHTYTAPGSYQVIFQITDGCGGTVITSQVINVVPSGSTYNTNCCSNTANYHFNDLDITSNTTWSPSSNPGTFIPGDGWHVYISGTVTVKTGALFTIHGEPNIPIYLEFGPNGKIIIERGARISLIGNGSNAFSYFTGLQDCGTMWQGVEVWGNRFQPQNPQSQGAIYIRSTGGIRDAHVGVLAGRTMRCFNQPCPSPPCLACFSPAWYHWAYGGGIVAIINTQEMRNNGVAVKFTPYPGSNISSIASTYFEGGILPDPGYTQGGSYSYPNSQNPLLAPATPTGEAPFLGHLNGVRDINFSFNDFNQAETGIEIHNGSAKIGFLGNMGVPYGNIFDDFTYAIRSFSGSNSLTPTSVIGNEFINFDYAFWSLNGQYELIRDNTFGIPANTQADQQTGIYMENTSGFEVIDNLFNRLENGLLLNNSGTTGGHVYAEDGGNIFTQVETGVRTWNNNSELQLRCNTHNNPVSSDYYQNWRNFGPMSNQGKYDSGDPNNDVNPAGNEFNPLQPNVRKEIFTLNWSFIIVPGFPPQIIFIPGHPYNYYRHSQSAGGTQSVTPTQMGPITVYNNGIPKTSGSCAPCFSCKNLLYVNNKKQQIATLEQERAVLASTLDANGNTTQLLGAIAGHRNGQLKDLLLASWPLSDTVLLAYIDRSGTPAGHLKEVLIPNSPVSRKVMASLNEKMKTLPKGIANQIRSVQGYNPDYRTLTSIDREMEAAHVERMFALNSLLIDTLNLTDTLPGDRQAAINILEGEGTYEADRVLGSTYLESGNYSLAANKINSLSVFTQEEADWVSLQNILLQLKQDSMSVFEMNATNEAFVRQLAGQWPESPAVSAAKSILRLVYGEDFPIKIPEVYDTSATAKWDGVIDKEDFAKDSLTSKSNTYLGANYPDPFNEVTYIPYGVPETCRKAELRVFDVAGNLVTIRTLNKGKNVMELSTGSWAEGMYFYRLEVDGVAVKHERMVLVR